MFFDVYVDKFSSLQLRFKKKKRERIVDDVFVIFFLLIFLNFFLCEVFFFYTKNRNQPVNWEVVCRHFVLPLAGPGRKANHVGRCVCCCVIVYGSWLRFPKSDLSGLHGKSFRYVVVNISM